MTDNKTITSFRRGALIAPPILLKPDGFEMCQTEQYLKLEKLATMYFDGAGVVSNNMASLPPTPGQTYLIDEGFMVHERFEYSHMLGNEVSNGLDLKAA